MEQDPFDSVYYLPTDSSGIIHAEDRFHQLWAVVPLMTAWELGGDGIYHYHLVQLDTMCGDTTTPSDGASPAPHFKSTGEGGGVGHQSHYVVSDLGCGWGSMYSLSGLTDRFEWPRS